MTGDRKVTTFEVEAFEVNATRRPTGRLPGTGDIGLGEPADPSVWERLTSDEREALIALVEIALDHMRANVAEWLPLAATARSNSKIGFFVLWENGLFHSEVLRMQARAKADEAARIAELINMAKGVE